MNPKVDVLPIKVDERDPGFKQENLSMLSHIAS